MIAKLDDNIVAIRLDIARLDEKVANSATKADLKHVNQGLRNWVITVGVSITALQFAIQYAMFQLYVHLR